MAGPGYTYPVPNAKLHEALKLEKHIEGGYYAVTHVSAQTFPVSSLETTEGREPEQVIRPKTNDRRLLGTTIYYLLDPASPRGYFHINASTTMHFHHAGRARYTLIRPSKTGGAPEVSYATVGDNLEAGEVRQLLVEGGVWKCSEIPPEDLASLGEEGLTAEELESRRERIGCLISELVFPGFEWEDHAFMTVPDLHGVFKNATSPDDWKKLVDYVRPDTR
ncbi:hypothetical protein DACRYDRAFT_97852 [Dacryopinax primogenitus]|uniref:DUF985 domain-containing protein n=1 Tax=Dacryopinax primogenitus (strain DJM 731) TaxID=1858805 RepID=M5G839_DACPD|nr:uncharacterized protein DACRYDRAFT_97852 [Dacryopinax primogenitus]EJU06381.1 hypothetical protein DACRYDRAFT_97852 [Dacryopinax primogenitus]